MKTMSQRSVEQVIGKLATDEDYRQRFDKSRDTALAEAIANGLQLTPVEQRALLDLDVTACERFAGCLDPRIQKISLRRNES
jgi:hypothetical protein